VAVPEALAEDVGFRQAPDAFDDDGGRRERQRDVRVQHSRRGLEPVLAGLPGKGREDDLFDEPAHLGVEHGARDEPAIDEDLAEPGAPLFGDRVERPIQVRVGDAAAPLQESADPLPFARRGRGAQLPFLEEEMARFVAADQRQCSLESLEEDPPQDLWKRRLGERSTEAGGCRLRRHALLSLIP
jgi:hypothetical protein